MKNILFKIMSGICLVSILVGSGCVAPPKETEVAPVDLYDPNQFSATVTTTQNPGLLESATPFQTQATPTSGYSVLQEITPIPEDMVCLIDFYQYDMRFESNNTAKSFDLKNPPMYINYSIAKPFNVSGTRIVTAKSGAEQKISYSYYSPYAYLDITIRDPKTGDIYVHDGFGKSYGSKLNKTIQIMKPGNMLIEINGFNVSPSVGFWVKPSGNINTDIINTSTLECRSQEYVKKLNQ
jgi:hypothetical protein